MADRSQLRALAQNRPRNALRAPPPVFGGFSFGLVRLVRHGCQSMVG